MCNWLKSIGDWKSIGNFFDKNSEIFLYIFQSLASHSPLVRHYDFTTIFNQNYSLYKMIQTIYVLEIEMP